MVLVAGAAPAEAQTGSLEEFRQALDEAVGEMGEYRAILQNPDVDVQIRAVELLLKSADPSLVRMAKEHALFSTNPVLRNVAVKAIFDAGGRIRLDVTARDESSADVFRWLATIGGTNDGTQGSAIIQIGEARDTCWIHYRDFCRLQLVGTSVQFQNHGNPVDQAQASLELGADGVLRGIVFSHTGQADLAIDLKE